MRFRKWLEEEGITTASVGELDADAVTSNKLLRVELRDNKIKKIVNMLKSRKNVKVTIEDGIATIDMPYDVPKDVMSKLSPYTV